MEVALAIKSRKGSRGTVVLFPLTSALDGMSGQRHAPATLPRKTEAVPTIQKGGHVPRPVWKGAENIAPTGLRSRTVKHVVLRYFGPLKQTNFCFNTSRVVVLLLVEYLNFAQYCVIQYIMPCS